LSSRHPSVAQEAVDLDAVHRIRTEALQNSQVMEHLFYLTDVSGSRLTNSPGFFTAADWIVKRLGRMGHQRAPGEVGSIRSRVDLHPFLRAHARTAVDTAHRRATRVHTGDQRPGQW
jgi:hypothetical protein